MTCAKKTARRTHCRSCPKFGEGRVVADPEIQDLWVTDILQLIRNPIFFLNPKSPKFSIRGKSPQYWHNPYRKICTSEWRSWNLRSVGLRSYAALGSKRAEQWWRDELGGPFSDENQHRYGFSQAAHLTFSLSLCNWGQVRLLMLCFSLVTNLILFLYSYTLHR